MLSAVVSPQFRCETRRCPNLESWIGCRTLEYSIDLSHVGIVRVSRGYDGDPVHDRGTYRRITVAEESRRGT